MYPGLICHENIDCITHYQPQVSLQVNSHSAIKTNTQEEVRPQGDDPSAISLTVSISLS